jgi:hypothetical protein
MFAMLQRHDMGDKTFGKSLKILGKTTTRFFLQEAHEREIQKIPQQITGKHRKAPLFPTS